MRIRGVPHLIKHKVREYYDSRNILKAMVYKSLVGNYKSTVIGFGWHFVTPLLLIAIYYITFTELKFQQVDYYWAYLTSGLFPFYFLMSCINQGSTLFNSNSHLIKKIYFPKEFVIFAHVIYSMIIMMIGLCIFFVLCIVLNKSIPAYCVLLPLFMILIVVFGTGLSLLLSSVVVYVRDIQYIISSTNIILFFVSPVYFLTNNLQGLLYTVVWVNPLTYYIEFAHNIMYGCSMNIFELLWECTLISGITLLIGICVFRYLKKGLVERL